MRDGGKDGAQGLEAHGDVQQMGGEEEVVEVSEDGHDGVPDQIQEVLSREREKERERERETETRQNSVNCPTTGAHHSRKNEQATTW